MTYDIKHLAKIKDSNIKNKKVIVRVDFNVPLKETTEGTITVADDKRIKNALETIQYLKKNNNKIILISHLGRPDGKIDKKLTLNTVSNYINNNFELKTKFLNQFSTSFTDISQTIDNEDNTQIFILENLRFNPGEKQNNKEYAQKYASLADIYVNDAFSVSHRSHASIQSLAQQLPHYAGFGLTKEIEYLGLLLKDQKRPFIIIVGGAKISDKVEAVRNLADIADTILVGGGVANNFLKADGIETHKSYLQEKSNKKMETTADYVKVAKQLIEKFKTEKILKDGYIPLPKILYPIDVIAAKNIDTKQTEIIDLTHDIKDTENNRELMYLDIGPKTTKLYQELILQAGTIFWNGPLGVFEKKIFETGTKEIARTVAKSSAFTVIGGGDTISAINMFAKEDRYDYVSASGGASLEFLAGKSLPGLVSILD